MSISIFYYFISEYYASSILVFARKLHNGTFHLRVSAFSFGAFKETNTFIQLKRGAFLHCGITTSIVCEKSE